MGSGAPEDPEWNERVKLWVSKDVVKGAKSDVFSTNTDGMDQVRISVGASYPDRDVVIWLGDIVVDSVSIVDMD